LYITDKMTFKIIFWKASLKVICYTYETVLANCPNGTAVIIPLHLFLIYPVFMTYDAYTHVHVCAHARTHTHRMFIVQGEIVILYVQGGYLAATPVYDLFTVHTHCQLPRVTASHTWFCVVQVSFWVGHE
jgi:hypothetical protein